MEITLIDILKDPAVISILISSGIGFILWFMKGRERKSQIRKTDNEALATLQNTLERLSDEYSEMSTELTQALKDIRRLEREVDSLQDIKRGAKILHDQLVEEGLEPRYHMPENGNG